MNKLIALAPLALLGACATYQDSPTYENGPAAPKGTLVPLDQPVRVGSVVATPKAVVEDSRCPENARCVWAGRLIVTTRIDGAGWRETANLTLGEPAQVRGVTVALVSGVPEKRADRETQPGDYRFAYEAR
jgi:hypothetical protein